MSASAIGTSASARKYPKRPFGKFAAGRGRAEPGGAGKPPPAEHKILFQQYFKSVGPRTYAAQVKEASNGNHYLVLTEGKRDEATGDVRKIRLFLFSEDFPQFFKMMHEVAVFIREHPVPEEVKRKRDKFWANKSAKAQEEEKRQTSAPNRR